MVDSNFDVGVGEYGTMPTTSFGGFQGDIDDASGGSVDIMDGQYPRSLTGIPNTPVVGCLCNLCRGANCL